MECDLKFKSEKSVRTKDDMTTIGGTVKQFNECEWGWETQW